jgi:hypothetical protein
VRGVLLLSCSVAPAECTGAVLLIIELGPGAVGATFGRLFSGAHDASSAKVCRRLPALSASGGGLPRAGMGGERGGWRMPIAWCPRARR